jgi:hypothetical protein
MRITLKELRQIVKDVIQETYSVGNKYFYKKTENGIEIYNWKSKLVTTLKNKAFLSIPNIEKFLTTYLREENKIDSNEEVVTKDELHRLMVKVGEGDED